MTYSAQMYISNMEIDISIMRDARDKNRELGNIITAHKCEQKMDELLLELVRIEETIASSRK